MHIVYQKQQEIQLLKNRLSQLQRLQLAEEQAENLSKQLIETLKNENIELQKTIKEIKQQNQQKQQLLQLRNKFSSLKKRNQELQQIHANLSTQISNMKLQTNRLNIIQNMELSRTHADDTIDRSRSNSEWRPSQYETVEFQEVAPALVDSRYTAQYVENREEGEEEVARPLEEVRVNLVQRINAMQSSGKRVYGRKINTYF